MSIYPPSVFNCNHSLTHWVGGVINFPRISSWLSGKASSSNEDEINRSFDESFLISTRSIPTVNCNSSERLQRALVIKAQKYFYPRPHAKPISRACNWVYVFLHRSYSDWPLLMYIHGHFDCVIKKYSLRFYNRQLCHHF